MTMLAAYTLQFLVEEEGAEMRAFEVRVAPRARQLSMRIGLGELMGKGRRSFFKADRHSTANRAVNASQIFAAPVGLARC